MRTTISILITIACFACGSKNREPAPDKVLSDSNTVTQEQNREDENNSDIRGYYVGSFNALEYKENKKPSYSNKINISIDSLQDGNLIYGHSVVAGNLTQFTGTYNMAGNIYEVTAKEPGTNKYDGVFNFTINPMELTLKGEWIANDKKIAVTKRGFELEKRTFSYDKNLTLPDISWSRLYTSYDDYDGSESLTGDVMKFNASAELLKPEDVENMFHGDLEVMRNSIYARHGYSFKNRKMRYVFDQIDWYIPVSVDIRKQLTDIEKKNIDLIQRYEEHAAGYYDAYGR